MKVKKLKDRNGVVFTPLVSSDSVFLRSSTKDLTTKLSELDTIDTTINSKIPSAASSSNQLADKNFVNSTIQTTTANYRGTFATWNDVPTDPTQYVQDYNGNTTPTQNDYMYVRDSSSYPVSAGSDPLDGVWKFKFIGDWSIVGKNGWNPEFKVNDTVFTQEQSDALNSGINSNLVSDYSDHVVDTDIHVTTTDKSYWSAKQPAITGAATTITDVDLSSSKALISDANGKVAVSNVTTTELGYISGVTSAIQSQIDSKQPNITGAASTIVANNLSTEKAVISNSEGKISTSNVTTTELGYLSGTTSSVQTQIDSKEPNLTGAATSISHTDLTASRALISNTSGKVDVSSVTSTELGYVSGVTSSIQTQINSKQSTITGAATTIIDNDLAASKALVSDSSGKVGVSQVTSTELGCLSGVTSSVQTQINTKANDAEVVHLDGEETITGKKIFTYYHDTAQNDNQPAIIASRIRINGQVGTASQKSLSQVDFYLNDENVGYMGCTRQNGATYLKVGANNDTTPLIFGYHPYQDNTSCLRFEKNHPVWRGGQTGTYSEDKALAIVGDIKSGAYALTNKTINFADNTLQNIASLDTAQTLINKTISKQANLIKDDVQEITSDATFNITENSPYFIGKDVRYSIQNSDSYVTVTFPNIALTNELAQQYVGLTKTITAGFRDHGVDFYGIDGTVSHIELAEGETVKLKCYYDPYDGEYLYWKKDVSDPDPVIVTQSGSTGEVIYDNSNQIVTGSNVTLELDDGDKQGREVSITFLQNGTLVYTDELGEVQTVSISQYTVSKLKWTGTGWIYETQKLGASVTQAVPLVPLMTSNTDQGFTLVPSSELTGYEAYNAFNEHPIFYSVGSVIMYDDASFATDNDGSNGYLDVIHNDIPCRYSYLHIIDRGSGTSDNPSTVTIDGITEYTIKGTQDGGITWNVLTTYSKSANTTEVIIQLNTSETYNGFKICTTGVSGTTQNVGFKKVQMYVPTKTVIQEVTENSNNVSAYTPLIPLMTSNSERGFALSMSSQKTDHEAFHACNQHALTFLVGNTGIVSKESCSTNNDGDNAWISCTHSGFSVSYGYVHIIDLGYSNGLNPDLVNNLGIYEYTIYGLRSSEWELITTYPKSPNITDVKIPLNTVNAYSGLKVCATSTQGGDIGWRLFQVYIPNKQEIQYVSEVDPDPVTVSESVHTGLITYYNNKFVVNTPNLTLTVDNADKVGRECIIIPNEPVTLSFTDINNESTTVTISKYQKSKLTWNGSGWYLETSVIFTGTNKDGSTFKYRINVNFPIENAT